jgi:hypothetical protein
MNTHSPAPDLAALRNQVAACETACLSAAQRAQDPHLQTRLTTLAGQLDALTSRIGGGSSAALASLMQEASGVAAALTHAANDNDLYQALLAGEQLCQAIKQDFSGQ